MKVNNRTTNYFKYEKGVPQGNPLSPILFDLYVNDIFETIVNQNPVSLDDTHNFNALMYADDLIIFSTTTDGLQKSLDSFGDYCGKWKLDINYTKTQKSLDSLSDYCGKWKLDINYTKTQKSLDSLSDYCGKWKLDINYTKLKKV